MGEGIILKDKQDSVEVSRNAKGEYAFKVKIYYNSTETSSIEVNNQVQETMKDLKGRF